MKKLLAIFLATSMILSATGCRSAKQEQPADNKVAETTTGDAAKASEVKSTTDDYKIGIITGTVSQGEEEFRAAENMKKKYGDKIVTATYPDNFTAETETLISEVTNLASIPNMKVIVFIQAVPGASAAIEKAREINPDVLFITGVPGEDPGVISPKADIVLQSDDIAMGYTMIDEAVKMGAKTFVHYSFPRHMSYSLLKARRDLLEKNAIEKGLVFVDATAPDPTGDAGVPGAQNFILEDVPAKIAEYGPDTAFFSTNCAMQEPLIKRILEEKAILPQQCCPSPYHAYPQALGIEIPEDKQGDVSFMLSEITKKVDEGGNNGRMATWGVPINMLMIEAGTEYGMKFAEGKTNGRLDVAVLKSELDKAAGGEGKSTITNYKEVKPESANKSDAELTDADYNVYDNYFLILCDYYEF